MNGSACTSGTIHSNWILSLFVAMWMSGAVAAQTDAPIPVPTGDSAMSPATKPAAAPAAPAAPAAAVKLFMPDGQLRSHAIRVFVTENLRSDQRPELRLLRSHSVTLASPEESTRVAASVVAPNQTWSETFGSVTAPRNGTLLLFDISAVPYEKWKPMMRVRPAVYWQDGAGERVVVSETEVNVGDIVPAFCWTSSIVIAAVLVVVLLAKLAGSSAWRFLTGVDGHLSLAQSQVALWTFVIGSVVLGYGLVKFEVPDIPASLLALMGASLATGGIAYFKDSKKQQTAAAAGKAPPQGKISLGDLVRTSSGGETSELSLAKAQLLFWTVLQLVLFLFKSVLDGVIWEVPWPLVALMGFSQAGYLAPKLAPQQ